jgi:erythromycin esterase-like protein
MSKPTATALAVFGALTVVFGHVIEAADWNQWRGPNRDGLVREDRKFTGLDAYKNGLGAGAFTGWQTECDDLVAAVVAGRPYNEADYGAASTMAAILGRLASYTGQVVEWHQAINSKLKLVPDWLAWDAVPRPKPGPDGVYARAVPGVTKGW